MMDGSSLRMIVGMNSALGTLEEMSWRQHRGRLRAQLPQTQWAVGGPRRSPPTAGQPVMAASFPGRACWAPGRKRNPPPAHDWLEQEDHKDTRPHHDLGGHKARGVTGHCLQALLGLPVQILEALTQGAVGALQVTT